MTTTELGEQLLKVESNTYIIIEHINKEGVKYLYDVQSIHLDLVNNAVILKADQED